MKFVVIAVIGCSATVSGQAQSNLCDSPIMTDRTVVKEWTTSTIPFAECVNSSCPTPGPELLMSVYVPTVMAAGVEMPARFPMIIMLPGGGFTSGNHVMFQWPEQYVKRGMIVLTIDYRLGWDVNGDGLINSDDNHSETDDPCGGDYSTQLRAVIRAAMDADLAVRYVLGDSINFPIDKDALFCGGPSAGGALAVHLGYAKPGELQEYWQSLFGNNPPLIGSPCDMRYDPIPCQPPPSSAGYYQGEYSYKGVMDCWGGLSGEELMDPHDGPDTGDTTSDQTAFIGFYGGYDHIFPPYVGPPYECNNYPDGFGSAKMFELRRKYGFPAQLYTDPDALHRYVWLDSDLPPGPQATAARLARTQFIVSRSCCFFKSAMCGIPCSYDAPMIMNNISDWGAAYAELFGSQNGEPEGCNNDGSVRFGPSFTHVAVYPNPSNGRVHIVGAGFSSGANYRIFDSLGRSIADGSIKNEDSPIELGQYPDGLYIIRLSDATHEYAVTVVLNRWTD